MKYDVADFIGDLEVAFTRYPPKDPLAEQRWVDLVKRKLGRFKPQTLRNASEDMTTTRTAKGFPSLAEMIKGCEKVMPRDEVTIVEPDLVREGRAAEAWSEGEKFWSACVASDRRPELFRTAAKEGWIICLKSFMVEHRKMPDAQEILDCKAEAVMFLEAYEDCVRDNGETIGNDREGFKRLSMPVRALEGLGDSMLQRREEVRCQILGETQERLK